VYAAAATKKKASQQKPFAHHQRQSLLVLVGKSELVYTSLMIVSAKQKSV